MFDTLSAILLFLDILFVPSEAFGLTASSYYFFASSIPHLPAFVKSSAEVRNIKNGTTIAVDWMVFPSDPIPRHERAKNLKTKVRALRVLKGTQPIPDLKASVPIAAAHPTVPAMPPRPKAVREPLRSDVHAPGTAMGEDDTFYPPTPTLTSCASPVSSEASEFSVLSTPTLTAAPPLLCADKEAYVGSEGSEAVQIAPFLIGEQQTSEAINIISPPSLHEQPLSPLVPSMSDHSLRNISSTTDTDSPAEEESQEDPFARADDGVFKAPEPPKAAKVASIVKPVQAVPAPKLAVKAPSTVRPVLIDVERRKRMQTLPRAEVVKASPRSGLRPLLLEQKYGLGQPTLRTVLAHAVGTFRSATMRPKAASALRSSGLRPLVLSKKVGL